MKPSARPPRLSGRNALITGASRGIGRAIALRYAEEGAYLCLVATRRGGLEEAQAMAEAKGAKVHLHCAGVSQRPAVQALGVEALAATVQAVASSSQAPRQTGHAQPMRIGRRQALIDTCHSYRSEGPLMQQPKAR